LFARGMESAVVRGVSEKVWRVRHVERQLYVIVTFQVTTKPKLSFVTDLL